MDTEHLFIFSTLSSVDLEEIFGQFSFHSMKENIKMRIEIGFYPGKETDRGKKCTVSHEKMFLTLNCLSSICQMVSLFYR